jgi:hypothetical protein
VVGVRPLQLTAAPGDRSVPRAARARGPAACSGNRLRCLRRRSQRHRLTVAEDAADRGALAAQPETAAPVTGFYADHALATNGRALGRSAPTSPTIIVASLAALGGMALAAQDKYTVQVPGGLAFSEFRGYEDWRVVAVSQTEDVLKAIVANSAMIDAYRAGVPGNGKQLPDGSRIAKIELRPKKNTEAPFSVNVPGRHWFHREG